MLLTKLLYATNQTRFASVMARVSSKLLLYEALTYECMKPHALVPTSVCGLELLERYGESLE
jgi:hypothetical protein